MTTQRSTLVFGPAYIDRVVRVDRALCDAGVIDRSTMGRLIEPDNGKQIRILGLPTGSITIDFDDTWHGPSGTILVGDHAETQANRSVKCLAWQDDLGGMGAGYAKALGARLRLLVGDDNDPINTQVLRRLEAEGIAADPVIVSGRMGEWTLLITSGPFGDKLPIGFRDPNPQPISLGKPGDACDLLVVASMTNARAAAALAETSAHVKMFAPAMRNMGDRSPAVLSFARHIDILCCNRVEWETREDREEVAWRLSLLVVTDGPNGAMIRYTKANGDAGRLEIPAFPRSHPPRDTNRAGEAFASTLVSTLLDGGWSPGITEDELLRHAASRASASAALVLDRVDFGFPSEQEIDEAVAAGVVR